jgi:2-oxo-3-hexenedioate decarboxylase
MNRAKLALYAEEMIRLADSAALAEPLTAPDDDFSIADGYAVAAEVLARRERSGWKRTGRKIGFTNRMIWAEYNVYQPIFGYMYDHTVIEAGPNATEAMFSLAGLAQPRIEPEIVFKLRAAPRVTRHPEEVLNAIEWVGHGFEIVQCHFPDWRFQAADTIADGGLHGR